MSGIEIHIHLSGDKEILPEKADQPSEADGLLVRLMNKDTLDDGELMKLTSAVVEYVRRKKSEGDMTAVKEFLCESNRAMMDTNMKELISEVLNPSI